MRRALVVLTFVAALRPHAVGAAPPVSQDAPLSAPALALAESLHVDPARDPGTFISSIVRVLYSRGREKEDQMIARIRAGAPRPQASARPLLVPVPLSAEIWSRAVFRRTVPQSELVATIALDRPAALLSYALAGMDDETLAFFADHASVLTELADRAAPAFGAFGASFRVHGNRVLTPGGDGAIGLWEAVVGESVERPDRFARALYTVNEGRLAYLYDCVANLDEAHAKFALGAWIATPSVRLERFTALVAAMARDYHEWHLQDLPFARPLSDFALLMARLRVKPSGEPAMPLDRGFWEAVFERSDPGAPRAAMLDAAYLADATGDGDASWRTGRLDEFSFGQRVFAESSTSSRRDAVSALQAFPTHRMLLLTLERMGIKAAPVFAACLRQSGQTISGDVDRTYLTLVDFQGALAVVDRMTRVGTFESRTAERLVASVCAVPIGDDGRYGARIEQWMAETLLPLLPRPAGPVESAGIEARLIAGLSGPIGGRTAPRIGWEGEEYRVDFAAGEMHRLQEVRARQRGYSMDDVFGLERAARLLQAATVSLDDLNGSAEALARLKASLGPDAPRDAAAAVGREIDELSQIIKGGDQARANRLGRSLGATADRAFSEALLSMVYAVDIGDPNGTALLASNVALRHDFGLTLNDPVSRQRRPWDVPRQQFQPGIPWKVSGSLLGLDIALAPMMLRRINVDRIADAPRLPPNERDAFAVGTTLMDPRQLRDTDRSAIIAAIERGRDRARQIRSPVDVDTVAAQITLDGWRTRALKWTLAQKPTDISPMFSLAELMVFGGGAPGVDMDAWGTSALDSRGCPCTEFLSPGSWPWLAGRPQVALIAALVSDLNLRVAMLLNEMHLPASLERPVLAGAVEDFIYQAAPSDPGDWWAVARDAQQMTRQNIEDYVAASAAIDGPLVPIDDAGFASQR